jgi:FecR protein
MKLAHRSTDSLFAERLSSIWPRALAAVFCGLCVAAASAQPGSPDAQYYAASQGERASDPPGRVGRLADVNGQVWLYSPDTGDWATATRNRPLTTGDRLATDAGARAEVRIGSTVLRLDGGSELEVLRLDDDRVSLQLHSGSVSARLRSREAAAEFEMKTGEGRFQLMRTGRYRFDREDEASHVTVSNGQARYEGPGSALTVYSGQRAEFWVDAGNTAQYSLTEPVRDAFAAWNSERDRNEDRSVSARFVSPEMTGVEDLDRHGRWEQNDEYGAIWYPRVVAANWAPYSTGHWTWVRPWGWTWVDDAPWGFAPFHYGRWVYYRNSWGWAPGTYVARPVYAPALVAWVGGPRLSVSINIGGGPAVGWFPLAPREIYVPSYRVTPRYVETINITHVPRIANVTRIINNPQADAGDRDFSNRKFPHAVTVVPTSVMTGRESVGAPAARLRDTPEVRDIVNRPNRQVALVAAPVEAPPTRQRAEAEAPPQAAPNRPMRPREREAGDAPRVQVPAETRPSAGAVQPEPRGRDAAAGGGAARSPRAAEAIPAPVAPAAQAQPAAPAQPVPMRSRVTPNPPVAPRTDVEPLPARAAPQQPPPPQPRVQQPEAQARPAQPAEPVRERRSPPQRQQQPPAQEQAAQPKAVPQQPQPKAVPQDRQGNEAEELLRKRQRGDQPQREGRQVN